MGRPFSERVAGVDWRREAEAWIGRQLERHGHRQTGEIEQPRIRPWSTQLTVPTDAGLLWFKANCAMMAFEPALHAELARLAPHEVDAPYAVDADRGWMLTVDRGMTLGDSHEPTSQDWQAVLAQTVRLQRMLADHREQVLQAGVPDCSPATVPDRFDRILTTFIDLPEKHPSHVPRELEARLRSTRSAIVDAAQLLAESRLPATWQHADIHPWNVFAIGGGALRLFDFGDSQWAHAAEALSVPYGWVTSRTSLDWREILEAYCAQWHIEPGDLQAQWDASGLTQPVNRALTWAGCLEEATAAEWQEWGDAPLHHLSRVLDP